MSCKPPVCLGDLTEVVSYQEATRPDDGYGGFENDVWTEVAVLYCTMEQKSGDETFLQENLRTIGTVVFWTPYNPDIKTIGRLVHEGVEHNIRSVDDWKRRKDWLKIEADFGVPD